MFGLYIPKFVPVQDCVKFALYRVREGSNKII